VVGKFYRSTTQSPRFQHNSDLQAAILTAQCSPEWIWTAPFGRCGGAGGVCRRPSAKTWSLRPPAGSMEEVIGQIACRLPELAEAAILLLNVHQSGFGLLLLAGRIQPRENCQEVRRCWCGTP
ncbi:unnamed protein product, partial [Durusdinium trenchii]